MTTLAWKPDWPRAQANLRRWWRREGLALAVTAPRAAPLEPAPRPDAPDGDEAWWTDAAFRAALAEHEMARTFFGGEAFPYFDTQIGPGSLGHILGARARYVRPRPSVARTVWYEPCIADPDAAAPIRFGGDATPAFRAHRALVEEGLRRSRGRYLVGMPDLIENLDTLAALRGTEALLVDLVERPAWVEARLAEINAAYFQVFDRLYERIRDADGGNAFSAFRLWGPGRTAKVQCDFSAMISPRMFRRFVVGPLTEQCRWLDWSLYHLDGTTALQHLEALLEIGPLQAIEWTPQAGRPGGGSPEWYDLYRRIRAAGKSVQAVGVRPEEVVPLLDAVGPQGLFILTGAPDQASAEALLAAVEAYR